MSFQRGFGQNHRYSVLLGPSFWSVLGGALTFERSRMVRDHGWAVELTSIVSLATDGSAVVVASAVGGSAGSDHDENAVGALDLLSHALAREKRRDSS